MKPPHFESVVKRAGRLFSQRFCGLIVDLLFEGVQYQKRLQFKRFCHYTSYKKTERKSENCTSKAKPNCKLQTRRKGKNTGGTVIDSFRKQPFLGYEKG